MPLARGSRTRRRLTNASLCHRSARSTPNDDPERNRNQPTYQNKNSDFCNHTHPCIADIVLHDFVLVEPSQISVVEGLWEVPVVECLDKRITPSGLCCTQSQGTCAYDKRCDTSSEEAVYYFVVESDTGLVHGVVSPSEGDNSGPGE